MSDTLLDTLMRDYLGKIARQAWIAYCRKTGDTEPSHLTPWEDLSEWEKEADRTIGEAIAVMMVGRKLPVTFAAAAIYAAIYDYEYRIRRKEWSAQRLDDAARETEEP